MMFLTLEFRIKYIVIFVLFSLFGKQEGRRNIQPVPLVGKREEPSLCPSVLALLNLMRADGMIGSGITFTNWALCTPRADPCVHTLRKFRLAGKPWLTSRSVDTSLKESSAIGTWEVDLGCPSSRMSKTWRWRMIINPQTFYSKILSVGKMISTTRPEIREVGFKKSLITRER